MKVKFEDSMKYKVQQRINYLSGSAVLRKDLNDLGSPRQVSRALKALVQERRLVKLGYGVYGKLVWSDLLEDVYLVDGFLITAREALTRLGVDWEPSTFEKDYNEGKSTQIPVNPPTRLQTRFRRNLSYDGSELRFE